MRLEDTPRYLREFAEARKERDEALAALNAALSTDAWEKVENQRRRLDKLERKYATMKAGLVAERDAALAALAEAEKAMREAKAWIGGWQRPTKTRRQIVALLSGALSSACQHPSHDCREHTVTGGEGTSFCARCEAEAREHTREETL